MTPYTLCCTRSAGWSNSATLTNLTTCRHQPWLPFQNSPSTLDPSHSILDPRPSTLPTLPRPFPPKLLPPPGRITLSVKTPSALRSLLVLLLVAGSAAATTAGERWIGTLATSSVTERGPVIPQWRFDLMRDETSYQLLLFKANDPSTVRRAIWKDGDRYLLWDGTRSEYGPVGTLEQALDLALGSRAADGFSRLLPASHVSSVDDPMVKRQHFIDQDSGIVTKTETIIDDPAAAIERAMQNEGLASGEGDGSSPPSATRWMLEIDSQLALLDGSEAPRFTPPSSSFYVESWSRSSLPPPADDGTGIAGVFGETIEVQVSSLVTRVVDSYGEPIRGLAAEDFRVRLGRQEATVLAADWVDLTHPAPAPMAGVRRNDRIASLPTIPTQLTEPPLILFFVQAGLDSSYTRGAMRFHLVVDELLASLPPGSKIAVVSYDSQLRLRLDFTTDKDRILEALERSIRFGGMGTERRRPAPSMAAALDFRAAKKAGTPEEGLQVAAEALGTFSGEKSLLYLGWGLGRFGRGGVRMTPDYEPARAALRDADVTVFVLDTTDADFHSLEVGLEQVARDTGGTYEKTNQFPKRAAQRLGRTLSGYYVLSVDRSGLDANRKRWRVELRDQPGTVLVVPNPR